MNVHQQYERLHGYHVYALAVKARDFEHFQIRDAEHHRHQQERERVQHHGVNRELRLGIDRPAVTERARSVQLMVTHPGEARGNHREGQRVHPRVSQRDYSVPVTDPGMVTQREHHCNPPVDTERSHTQHGVSGQESVQKPHHLTENVSSGLRITQHPDKSQRHAGGGQKQVAERQVEYKQPRNLLANFRIVQEADQHQHVGQQRHNDDHDE